MLGEIGAPARADAALAGTQRSTTETASRGGATGAHPVTPRKQRRAKFLIAANMRTGSTWLEALLGTLPDIATEYELKWRPRFTPLPVHLPVDFGSPQIGQLLEAFESDQPVVGSKLILDLDYISGLEFAKLGDKIDGEIRIIHLVRNLREIFVSRRRGAYHRLNQDRKARVAPRLEAAIIEADIDKASAHLSPEEVTALDCYDELCVYVRNDARIARLRRTHRHYLRADYGEIAGRMTEIARFAGSEAAPEIIAAALANPPTLKLLPVEPDCVVTNIAELTPYFKYFEALRLRLFDKMSASDGALTAGATRT